MKFLLTFKSLKRHILLLIGCTFIQCFGLKMTPQIQSISPVIVTTPFTSGGAIFDIDHSSLPNGSGTFVTTKVNNYVKLAVNHNYPTLVTNAYKYNVELEIVYKDINYVTYYTITKILYVEYDPASGVAYRDYSSYNFTGAHWMDVTVKAVRDAATNAIVTAPEQNLIVTYGIEIERFKDFNYSIAPPCPNHTATDLNADGEADELTINWSPITEAEEYELEWTYVDDYTNGAVASTASITSIEYNFKYNSTRVSLKGTSYKLNLIYERGYVIYRVRAVGRKLSNTDVVVNGTWSKPDHATDPSASPCTSSYYYFAGHQKSFNWQYSSTYAEEGKKKEVVGYYDGSLRNRQTVTKVNTTDTAIVGESVYDFQGRKAIDILPVPAQSPALTYYKNFNLNTGSTPIKYSREDFDKDVTGMSCTVNAGEMSSTSGASRYYSTSNTNSAYHQTYLPNAFNYPFNQVEYTPDNTGRIRTMGGVGLMHQLGSGQETKYYYGRPLQEELDRLFGSEVGYDRHYKKNVVIDPNGQVSISYLDQEGHVIATALSGDKPDNVSAIASESAALTSLNADLFSKNSDGTSYLNVKNIEETSITFNTQYLVSTGGLTHTFDYSLAPEQYTSLCLPDICLDCIYDLEVKIRNECGELIYSNIVRVGSLTLNNECAEGIEYVPASGSTVPSSFDISNMAVGNYQISKILTVNTDAYSYYLSQYLDANKNICFKTYEILLAEEQDKLAGIECEDDCESCIESLGTSDNYVLDGKGAYEDWLNAYNECLESCKGPSICEQAYQTMLYDMAPGGQYAEWYESASASFNASAFPLSILNVNNKLPLLSGVAAYWKNPKYYKKSGTYPAGYFEKDGITRSRIPVLPVQGGYFPPVQSGATFTYVNGVSYVYPEQLENVKDFVSYWQESWAKSLVVYHPEFCYFKWCDEKTIDTCGNTTIGYAALSSEDFDAAVLGTDEFSDAVSNGWVSPGTASPYALLNSDPYFNFVTDGIAQLSEMQAQIDDYLGSTKSMKEIAAISTMCPGFFDGSVSLPSTCTAFGTSFTSTENDEMWVRYRSFYISAKQKLIKMAADNYAILICGNYNGCIGKKDFDPIQSAFRKHWSSGPFINLYTPCGNKNFALYKDKVIRFGLADDMKVGGNEKDAGFDVYYRTGLCPAAVDFSNWLHTVASDGDLQEGGL